MEKVLQVKVKKEAAGGYLYPDFDNLAIIIASSYVASKNRRDKWCQYIDNETRGWMFDKTCSINQVNEDSPKGTRLGMLVVPAAFADQAAAMFSEECSILNDAEAQTFYESKVSVYEGSEKIDLAVLQGIQLKTDLSIPLTPEEADAVNPAKDQPGVVTSKTKTWAAVKDLLNIELS